MATGAKAPSAIAKRSGLYPEPRGLGLIQHDMMMFDHGMPVAKLAWAFRAANDKYATHCPAAVGLHMSNTESMPFMDEVAAISLRENERGMQIGAGWNPHWHQPSDLYSDYSGKDFLLGLNAAQTTLAAAAELVGVKVKD